MLERDIESRAVAYARRLGWYVRKFTSPHRRSAPDDIFAYQQRTFWIEFKKPGGVPTELQQAEHDEMRSKGLTVYVADNLEYAKAVILAESQGVGLA